VFTPPSDATRANGVIFLSNIFFSIMGRAADAGLFRPRSLGARSQWTAVAVH